MSKTHPSLWETTSVKPNYPRLSKSLEVDVAIIGGGITGLTLADALQKQGLSICLLERNELMSGTTGQTSAHLSTLWDLGYSTVVKHHNKKTAKALSQSLTLGLEHIKNRSKKIWKDIDFKTIDGHLYSVSSDDDSETDLSLSKERSICEELGFSTVEMSHDLLPFEIEQGFTIFNQARFHPLKYLNYLLEGLDSKHTHIFEHSPITHFSEGEVETPQAKVKAKAIVQATHTPMGVDLTQTALLPYRSYVIAGPTHLNFPDGLFWDTHEPYHYIRKAYINGEDLLIVGGSDRRTGDEQEMDGLERTIAFAASQFAVRDIKYQWSSQVYVPADALPIVGEDIGKNNSYIATGFSGDGLTMGTASALIIADLITKGSHPWEKFFSAKRNFTFNKDFLKHNAQVTKHFIKDRITHDQTQPHDLSLEEGCVQASLLTSPKAYYKDINGQLNEMSAVCPHMKCVVQWNEVQKTFDCPCHGSRFNCQGEVIEGPALSGLKHLSKNQSQFNE